MLANDLATVYDEKGRYNKAIRLAEKAIKIASETAPGNLATYKYNLGHILMHKGIALFINLYVYVYLIYTCLYMYIYIYMTHTVEGFENNRNICEK